MFLNGHRNALNYLKESKKIKTMQRGLRPSYMGGERLTKQAREYLKPLIRESVIHALMLLHQGNDPEGLDVYQVADEFHCKPGFVRDLFNQMIDEGQIVQLSGKSGSNRIKYHLPPMRHKSLQADNQAQASIEVAPVHVEPVSRITPEHPLTKEAILAVIEELKDRRANIDSKNPALEEELCRHDDSIATLQKMLVDF